VLSTHTFLWGKAFDVKRGSRNNNNWGLKGLANIEITKALIFVNVNLYSPYYVSVSVKFGRPCKTSQRALFGKLGEGNSVLNRHR